MQNSKVSYVAISRLEAAVVHSKHMLQVMIIKKDILVMKFLLLSALRRVIKKYSSVSLPLVPSDNEKAGYGPIYLQKTDHFFDILNRMDSIDVVESEQPISMEALGQVGRIMSNSL